jgi:hypothetical protein
MESVQKKLSSVFHTVDLLDGAAKSGSHDAGGELQT